MNKKDLFFVWTIALLLLFILIAKNSFALSVAYSVNSSMFVNSSMIILSIGGYNYVFSNSNFNSTQQSNLSILVNPEIQYLNITYNGTIIQYLNNTLVANTTVNLTCNQATTVNISQDSLNYLESKIGERIESKGNDVKNKLYDDIIFQLKPSQAKLDEIETALSQCKDNMTKAQIAVIDSNVQQEKWFLQYQDVKKENDVWMYIMLGSAIITLLVIAYASGLLTSKWRINMGM